MIPGNSFPGPGRRPLPVRTAGRCREDRTPSSLTASGSRLSCDGRGPAPPARACRLARAQLRLPIGAPRRPGRTHARTPPPPGPPAWPVAAAVTGFVRLVPGGEGDVGPCAAAGGGGEREAAPQGGAEPEGELRRPAAGRERGREGEGRDAASGGAANGGA